MKNVIRAAVLVVVVLGYQNCAPNAAYFSEVQTDQSSSIPADSCNSHSNGSTWMEPTTDIISENGACEFGGNLIYNYGKNVELICLNNAAVPTGNYEKGALLNQTGACLPQTCNGKPEGSTWSITNGTVTEPKSCPSSSVMVNSVYKKLDNYLCQSGKEVLVNSSKGDYVGVDGSCPAPDVSVSLSKATAAVNSSVGLITSGSNVSSMSFSCTDGQAGSLPIAQTSTQIKATQDLTCTVVGKNSESKQVSKSVSLSVTCGENEVKSGGKCVAYSCKSFVEIKSFPVTIPARTVEGVCYYAKLFSKIAVAPSSGSQLANVIARDHKKASDTSLTNVANPYVMGAFTNKVTLAGERTVKLSGSGSSLSSILVDNFVLVGSRLSSSSAAISNYRAWGSADTAIGTTGKIKVNNADVALTAFESGGTATIGTLVLTSDFAVGKEYELNINALDCGGSKALSDVYLIFQ
ncbi:MAG: hypothetical protein J7501_00520 [Bdellovibrio sp.]|nr:hypothetical protein [Bdellovibrio sp.]